MSNEVGGQERIDRLQERVKNLGQVAGIVFQTFEPNNKKILWYDERITEGTAIMYYDFTDLKWKSITENPDLDLVKRKVADLETKMLAAETNINSLINRVTINEGLIDTLNIDMAQAKVNISNLQNNYTTLAGRVTTAEGKITVLQTDTADLKTRMLAAEGSITSIQSEVNSIKGRLTTAEGDISSLKTRVSTLETDSNTAKQNITDLQTRLLALESTAITSVQVTGTGNVVTGVSKNGNVLTVTKDINALTAITKAMVEAVLTGVIGTHEHDRIKVLDNRDVVQTPINMGERVVQPFFSRTGMPGSGYWSGLHISGWTSTTYSAIQIVGPCVTTMPGAKELYFRTGVGENWNPWKKLAFNEDLVDLITKVTAIETSVNNKQDKLPVGTVGAFFAQNASGPMWVIPMTQAKIDQGVETFGRTIDAKLFKANLDKKADKTVTKTATIPVSSWSTEGTSQKAKVEDVAIVDNTVLTVYPTRESQDIADAAQIFAQIDAAVGSFTVYAKQIPTDAITVTYLIQN